MKKIILLITIIFFSFGNANAGSADNKGLDCNVKIINSSNKKSTELNKIKRIVLWFNNGKVEEAGLNEIMLQMGLGVSAHPEDKTLSYLKYEDNKYLSNPDFLKWEHRIDIGKTLIFHTWEVNRKTLIVSHTTVSADKTKLKNSMSEEQKRKFMNYSTRQGVCKVFTDFSIVEKFLEEKKLTVKKSMEQNKI